MLYYFSVQAINFTDDLVYSKLKYYLEYNFRQKEEDREKVERKQEDAVPSRGIEHIPTTDALVQLCNMKKLCLISFLDGRVNKDSVDSFERSKTVLEEVQAANSKRSISYGWVNATCQVMIVLYNID